MSKSKAKASDEQRELDKLLAELRDQALPIQHGGFEVDAIPTGIASFDLSTGVGGIPRRRISLLAGREASGKTLILLALIANVQRSGGRAAFIDAEHALTPGFATLLGVNYNDLLISRPRTLEQCYDVAKKLCSSGLFDVVGFDSVVALATEADLELSAAESTKRAGQAQVHSNELKKITSLLHNRTALVMINQIRIDPNPPPWWTAGPKEYEPGGSAIPFYASLRVKVKKKKDFKAAGGQRVGQRIHTNIIKNKVAPPFHEAEFDIKYTDGIDTIMGLIDTCLSVGVIIKKSSWFYLDVLDLDTGEVEDELKWAGRVKMEKAIKDDKNLQEHLSARLIQDDDYEDDDEEENGWDNVR